MEQEQRKVGERCAYGRCWAGPSLMISTKGGAVMDLRTWVRIMLSRHYDKRTTLGMMDCLTFTHIREEHVIVAFAQGREPHASVIREVYARVVVEHNGILKSNCSEYHFAVVGDREQEHCDALVAHYGWLGLVAKRREVMQSATG